MRVGVILFNLGGPDKRSAVAPFLKNLFSDPAILRVPFFVRPFLARYIARRREKIALENYEILGGKSPLLELTLKQAEKLETYLKTVSGVEAKIFVSMRYWHPFSRDITAKIKEFAPDKLILLPLYPQFSSTTSASSLRDWREAACDAGIATDVSTVCCWYHHDLYIKATVDLITRTIDEAERQSTAPLRLLFSAHGLPESIVKKGDPYQDHIEKTVALVMDMIKDRVADHEICYQSRATPQEWLKPSLDTALMQAAADQKSVVIAPIAFVSDHSETLVELDVEYRHVAEKLNIPGYFRVPAHNDHPGFIAALGEIVNESIRHKGKICLNAPLRDACKTRHKNCPFYQQ